MNRLKFDSQGRLAGFISENEREEEFQPEQNQLKNSDSLQFLKEETPKAENISLQSNWNLNNEDGFIKPLKFSNGKNQENIVKEIIESIKNGERIIFLRGACGSGKSAIALNVARIIGKTSIIVPVKNLQRQYEEDYTNSMFLIKQDGKKMKIAVLTGRDNHDSIIVPGVSCADPELPENIKISEKNYGKIAEYYKENPFLLGHDIPDVKNIRRVSIAPANPYWSPILPSTYELNQLKDAKKIRYDGCDGREYIFYHRKPGCSYYDQYLAYKHADVIIFNSAKYMAELAIGRKPETEAEIIDEADEFLDSLFQQEEINLTRLSSSLINIFPDNLAVKESLIKIVDLIKLEEQNKRALGIDENKVFHISETKLKEIVRALTTDKELESEIILDEQNYAYKAMEIAANFSGNLEDIYLTFRKIEENLFVKLVSTNLSPKIQELLDKNKSLVFMSGTLHSENVLKHIFGIKKFKVIEAEALNKGGIDIIMTGKEFDCKYANFSANRHSREDYLKSLSACLSKAPNPSLIHVHAFQDLPTNDEKFAFDLDNLISQEKLREIQNEDKTGKAISMFKNGANDRLFSTKCTRGVDFPGSMCRSIVFTKYPNPNVSDTFWKILQKTHPNYYWEFYRDKAYREFLQRIYRAVRSHDDHVYILSPDIRVIRAVQDLQNKSITKF